MARERAGSFLGKLVKDYGQKLVLDAVRDCAAAAPAKPSEWLVARCQERREVKGGGLFERNLQVAREWASKQGGA